MAFVNKISNTATITYGGNPIVSNTADTILLLAPTITKLVDKATANVGDKLVYTITISNVSLTPISNIPFTDTIAAGATYVTDSFKVNNTAVAPTINGSTLSYTIPTIAASAVATIQFQVTVVGSS